MSLRTSLWLAQAAEVVLLGATATMAVWLALRWQFDVLQLAGLAERRRWEAQRLGLAGALDQAIEGVVMTDPEGRIQYVNAAFSRMTGYSAAEAIGQNPRLLKSGCQDAALYHELWTAIRAGRSWQGILKNRRRDGSLYTEEMSITPLEDAAGAITGYIAIKQDVTERRAAEESRDFLASIVEATGDAVIGRDPDGRIISWNHGAEQMYGYRAEEVLGQPVTMLVPPDRAGHIREVSELGKRGESIPPMESIAVRKDGTRISIFLTVCPIRNAAGKVTALAAIIRDITARKRAEEARSLLAAILEASDDAVVAHSPDGKIISWNRGAEQLHGYRADEVLGRQVDMLIAPESLDQVRHMVEGLRNGESFRQVETVVRRKDGVSVDVQVSLNPIRSADGVVTATAAIVRDISARKRAEQALRESEEKFRSLVANIPDVLWTAGADGRLVFMTRNCERMLGYTSAELCESTAGFERIHPEDVWRAQDAYQALFAEGRPYDVEFRMQHKDGSWIWVHGRATNSYEKNGKRYTDGIISDITGQKRAFETIEHLRRRTELILDSAGEGILGLDVDGRITFANSAAARMLGSGDLIGKLIHDLVIHTRPDGTPCSAETCAIHSSIRNGTERHSSGDIFRCGDDRSFPVEFSRAPKMENGCAIGAVVVFRDITAAKLAEQRIQASLQEKEALLREIHHRVKNNLQVVCSLLSLQSRSLKDPDARSVFEGTRHRVKAMALVHETLYQSGDLAGIDFSAYVSRLVPQLMHAYGVAPERVRLSLEVASAVLPIDTAIPCALMLTELVSNSLKHAVSCGREGELHVVFRHLPERMWLLEVRNPVGAAPAEGMPRQSASFGLRLVSLLTEQLNGNVQIQRSPDFCVTVIFPAADRTGENGS